MTQAVCWQNIRLFWVLRKNYHREGSTNKKRRLRIKYMRNLPRHKHLTIRQDCRSIFLNFICRRTPKDQSKSKNNRNYRSRSLCGSHRIFVRRIQSCKLVNRTVDFYNRHGEICGGYLFACQNLSRSKQRKKKKSSETARLRRKGGRDDRIRTCEISRSQSERDTKLRHIPIFNFRGIFNVCGILCGRCHFWRFFRKSHKPKIRIVKGVFEVLGKSPEWIRSVSQTRRATNCATPRSIKLWSKI